MQHERYRTSLFNILLATSIACVLFAVWHHICSGLAGYQDPIVAFGLLGTTVGATIGALRYGFRGALLAGAICGTLTCILGLVLSFAVAMYFAFSSGGERWWF